MIEPHSPITGEETHLWSCPDAEASEYETSHFIGALVALTKPKVAVEVGAYRGFTTAAIGKSMLGNGRGELHAFEGDKARAAEANGRCVGLPVSVRALIDTDFDVQQLGLIDLLFIDGHLHNRQESYEHWAWRVTHRGLIVVHDSLKYAAVSRFAERIPYPRIHLRTPRGLTVAVKDTYEWELL